MSRFETHLREIIREQLLAEELGRGVIATVYHGTDTPPYSDSGTKKSGLIDILMKDEFSAGGAGGSAYGPGLYSVTDLDIDGKNTQTKRGHWGSYIYKIRVKLDGYLALDGETERLIYGKNIGIVEQAKLLGLPKEVVRKIEREIKNYDGDKDKMQASLAASISRFISGRVKGLVFSSSPAHRDVPMGRTVVTYDPGTMIPLSYARVTRDDFGNLGPDRWYPIGYRDPNDVRASAMRSAMGQWQEERYGAPTPARELKRIAKLPKDERIYNQNTFEMDAPRNLSLRGVDEDSFKVKSLPDFLQVKGDMLLDGNKTLKELPAGLKVSGSLNLKNSLIKELPPDLEVGVNLNVSGTEIKEIPPTVRVGGRIYGFAGEQ